MKILKTAIKERNKKMSSLILLISAITLASVGQVLLKKGMVVVGVFNVSDESMITYFLKAFTNIYIIIGFLSFAASTLVWLLVLSKLPLSLAYPCVALGYIIVTILSKVFFNEVITFMRWLGIVVICIGVFLISRSG
ncbi:MAG: EamA family transporter [Candidatus Omnitrophota bacterium]